MGSFGFYLQGLAFVGPDFDPGHLEELPGGKVDRSAGIFVAQVDEFLDAGLNDGFRALVAGEEGHVNRAAPQVAPAPGIEDGVELGMANVEILAFESFPVAPGDFVVVDPPRHAVIADRDDLLVAIDDAGADLGRGVFAPHRRKEGNAHEVFVPA